MTRPFLFLGNYRILLLDSVLIGYRLNPDGTTQNHSRAHALTLHGFFEKLRNQPNSIPMSILKTQVARAIIYFAAELRLKDFPLHNINSEIRTVYNKRQASKYLKFADNLDLYAP